MSNINNLPPEILVHIFCKLGSTDILRSVIPVCKKWYWLIQAEVERGRSIKCLLLDVKNCCLTEGDNVAKIVAPYSSSVEDLKIVGYQNPEEVRLAILSALAVGSKIKNINLTDCNASLVRLNAKEFKIRLVTLKVRNTRVSTDFWEDLGAMKKLTKLMVPGLPTGFVPYIMHNKLLITDLRLGQLTNSLIFLICLHLKGSLQYFHFMGGSTTYSGFVSILQCLDTIQVLKIQEPMYATKHSLKMLSHLTNLRCLKLYCRGRMPFTNPGKLGFFLDQQEQCVDYLFSSGSLEYLEDLDLSAFCQTVDSNLVQLICSAHLSIRSTMKRHLKRVYLSNCYHVGDAGIKCLVGSPVSDGINELDLSGTYVTGSCFFRQMTRYLFFKSEMDTYNIVQGLESKL